MLKSMEWLVTKCNDLIYGVISYFSTNLFVYSFFFNLLYLKKILLDIFCTKCRGRGHNANDCREKERGSYRGKQEYNNR